MDNRIYSAKSGLEPIIVIGLDCNDPAALNKILHEEKKLLQDADMICGGKSVLKVLSRNQELAGRLLPLTPPLEPIFECLANLRAEGMRVVALADGDPLFYGFGASLAKRLGPEAIRIRPAITALQTACAELSLPWHNVFCMSLHGKGNLLPLYGAIARNQTICALMSALSGPDLLARILLDRGVDWYDVYIFERMGKPEEKTYKMSLEECAISEFESCTTVVLKPDSIGRHVVLGLPGFHPGGREVLKMPVRGAILELLRINPSDRIWNIGIGPGALAMEAGSIAYLGEVIAVVEDWQMALNIQQNRKLKGAVNLRVCLGKIPDCLESLPQPQRIFLGINLATEQAPGILNYCVNTLPESGRLVIACHLLESFSICRKYLEKLRWPLEIQQIQVANVAAFGPEEHFKPIDPVFLLAVQKPMIKK